MLILIEGIVMCFVLLIICVVGKANGAVGLVVFYEDDVKKRVVELGLITEEKIKKEFRYYNYRAVSADIGSCSCYGLFYKRCKRIP